MTRRQFPTKNTPRRAKQRAKAGRAQKDSYRVIHGRSNVPQEGFGEVLEESWEELREEELMNHDAWREMKEDEQWERNNEEFENCDWCGAFP